MNVQERFNNIIKQSFDSLLKNNGFKKKGSYYVRESEELIYKIKIKKAWYNTKDSLTFDFVWEIYPTQQVLKNIPFPFLVDLIGGDLGKVANNKYGLFALETTDRDLQNKDHQMIIFFTELIGRALEAILQLKNIKDIIKTLEDTSFDKRYWRTPSPFSEAKDWIACMYYMIGEKKKGIKILDDMIKESKDASFKKNLEETRDQMISGL